MSSTTLLVALREITESPILMVGNGGETAMVEALMSGADVYLERPVRIRELAARVPLIISTIWPRTGIKGQSEPNWRRRTIRLGF